VTDGSVSITTIDAALTPPVSAYLTLNATSEGSATTAANSYITQDFSGTFSITSATGDRGTNYLSGTFTDAVGNGKNATFTLSASQPPTSELTLTSDPSVISGADLSELQAMVFGFADVTPGIHLDGDTIAPFQANLTATFSGTYPTPEPASIAVLLVGLTGIGFLRRHRA
jgi:hypothetical protein